jgi:hypothetical protein
MILASGAKALVCKADDRFVMIVLPADRKLASKAVRKSEGVGCQGGAQDGIAAVAQGLLRSRQPSTL